MYLRPSEIFFSQAEINNVFRYMTAHRNVNIGTTLDDLADGQIEVSDIPTIEVLWRNGKWVTADNRRLWVFRHLEKLGKCTTIPVDQVYDISIQKLSSTNGGRTVQIHPGRYASGRWHLKVPNIDPDAPLAPCAKKSLLSEQTTQQSSAIPRPFSAPNALYQSLKTRLQPARDNSFRVAKTIPAVTYMTQNLSLTDESWKLDPQEIRKKIHANGISSSMTKISGEDVIAIRYKVYEKELIKQDLEIEKLKLEIEILKHVNRS